MILKAMIKILVNTDISIIGFYGYIENISGYFYKNIDSIKIIYIYILNFNIYVHLILLINL